MARRRKAKSGSRRRELEPAPDAASPAEDAADRAAPAHAKAAPIPFDAYALGLFVLVVACYSPSWGAGFVYDDFPLILDQPVPRSFGDFAAILGQGHWNDLPYYRPLSRLLLGLEKLVFGDSPAGYYVVNTLLLASGVVLLFRTLRLPAFDVPRLAASLGAAIFGLHPLAVDALHPASAGPETLLSAVLTLAALHAFLRAGRRAHALSATLLGLALLAKEQALALLIVLAAADAFGLSADAPGRSARRWIVRHGPLVAVAAGYLLLRSRFVSSASGPKFAVFTHPERPLLSLVYALETTFAPSIRPIYEPRTLEVWLSPLRLAVTALAIAALGYLVRTHWAAVRARFGFFAVAWLALLLPAANLFTQETPFAERYVFFAWIGAAGAVSVILGSYFTGVSGRRNLTTLGAGGVAVLASLSAHRAAYYRDDITFLTRWAESDPQAIRAFAFLGEDYHRRKDYRTAIEFYRKAMASSPREAGLVYGPLGLALEQTGQLDEAIQMYRRAVAAGNNPRAPNLLANALRKQGTSSDELERLVQQNPNDVIALLNLGVAASDANRPDEALKYFQQALEREPGATLDRADRVALKSKIHYNMARVLAMQQRTDEAITHYRSAIDLDPGYAYAHTNLGILLLDRKQLDPAIEHFESAIRAMPDLALAKTNLEKARALKNP
jgi:tetratricopeptide (TPR) repeat protein